METTGNWNVWRNVLHWEESILYTLTGTPLYTYQLHGSDHQEGGFDHKMKRGDLDV